MKKKIFQTEGKIRSKAVERDIVSDVLFLMGAIKAAQNSGPEIRQKILSDVKAYTGQAPGSFAFMFASDYDNNDHGVFDMPNSGRRRKIVRDNFLNAAE